MASSTLFERLGLPSADDGAQARDRTRERFDDLVRQGQIPWSHRLEEPPPPDLSQCTGLPTYADIFGTTPCFEEWVRERYPDDGEDKEPEDDAWDIPWWIAPVIAGGVWAWDKLDTPFGFDSGEVEWEFDGFEIDGIPWTIDVEHQPGPPLAARVGEMLLHGNQALPGPGSKDVLIGGQRALTVRDAVAACPRTTTLGVPHAPQRTWTTWNTSVLVNGELLLRQGDWVLESPGGANPLIGGMPSVFAGPQAQPVMVQEETYKGLDSFVDDLERVGWKGGKVTLKASVSWTYKDVVKGLGVIGLAKLGTASPVLQPATAWGVKQLLASMNKPEIELLIEVDGGTVYGDFFEKYEVPGPGGVKQRVKRERHEVDLPKYYDERSADVDPVTPWPPTKKDEKSGTKTTPIDEDSVQIDEDEITIGPYRKKTQKHDADQKPKDWDE